MKLPSLIRQVGVERIKVAFDATPFLRGAVMVGDDAAVLGLRKILNTTEQATRVPQLVDRAQSINDPNHEPIPGLKELQTVLRFTGKMATYQVPIAPEAAGERPLNRTGPIVSGNFKSHDAMNAMTRTNQGSMAPSTFPKVAGEGNAQVPRSESTPISERSTLAGGSMTTGDSVNSAFDKLRSFLKTDNASMNTQSQDVTMDTPNW